MKPERLLNILTTLEQLLGPFVSRHSLVFGESDINAMGEWYVVLENDQFTILVTRDRGNHESIEIGSKVRPRPRAHKRQWSLSHLRGFLEGGKDHYSFKNLADQVAWLGENEEKLLDVSLLNSDEMNKWAVKASQRLFRPRK